MRSHVPHIAGLHLPPIDSTDQELLDKEYADDTALYRAFSVENMDKEYADDTALKVGLLVPLIQRK